MNESNMKNPCGLYIHIPYCRSKCDYCSFYSIPAESSKYSTDAYVARLVEEMESYTGTCGSCVFDTVYIGGGTPSILSIEQVERVLGSARSFFNIADDREITLEMNPDDLLHEKLTGFRDAGITRIVLGLQSSVMKHRKTIGRRGLNCSADDLELFFSIPGITRCLDFIGGIPGQTVQDVDEDISIIRRFMPEHVSLYMLSVEDGTPLASRISCGDAFEENQRFLWEHAIGSLTGVGYRHYEISNFALPGFESRHNMKYWNFTPYLGLGPAAHSFLNNRRFGNPPSLDEYMKPGEFRRIVDCRNGSQLLVEFIMTALRRLDGFHAGEYTEISGSPLPDEVIKRLKDKENEGLIRSENGLYRLTEKGVFLADRVIYDIIEPFL